MKNSPGCDIIENNIRKNYIYMYCDDNGAKKLKTNRHGK